MTDTKPLIHRFGFADIYANGQNILIYIKYGHTLFKFWFQSHFQSYPSCYIHKLFKRKKFIFNRQIMVLNWLGSILLILMSQHITEEQNLPANLQ